MTEPTLEENIRRLRRYPDKCCAEVSRKGESQPCDKTAVAVATDTIDGTLWPVCPHHSRGRPMLPLAKLVLALQPDLTTVEPLRWGPSFEKLP